MSLEAFPHDCVSFHPACHKHFRNLILAYCWPSHCLAYLKTLEEQRHRQRGISGNALGLAGSGGLGGMNGPAGMLGKKRGMPSLGSLSRLSLNFSELESLNRTIEEVSGNGLQILQIHKLGCLNSPVFIHVSIVEDAPGQHSLCFPRTRAGQTHCVSLCTSPPERSRVWCLVVHA